MTRREFFKRGMRLVRWSVLPGMAYPLIEAKICLVTRRTVRLDALPAPFDGLRVAFLSDIHRGPYVPAPYVRHVVRMANSLHPDLVLLGGDYVHRGGHYCEPAMRSGRCRRNGYWRPMLM